MLPPHVSACRMVEFFPAFRLQCSKYVPRNRRLISLLGDDDDTATANDDDGDDNNSM